MAADDPRLAGGPRDPGEDLAHAILGPQEVEIFENLYAAYADVARRTAFDILHDRDLAADAAHTAYLELLRYILGGKRWDEPASARSAVLRNTSWAALKILRARRRRPEVEVEAAAAVPAGDTWARTEARALCEQVVERLRPAQQTALRLRFVDGLSNAQCAARLEIGTTVFEKRLARAVRAARRAAKGVGLVSVLAVLRRSSAGRRRRPGTGFRPAAQVRSLPRPDIGRVAMIVAVAGLGVAAPLAWRAAQPADAPMRLGPSAPAAALAGGPDTLTSSVIIDGMRLADGTVVLLGEGRTCGCGMVFARRGGGGTWSAMSGPESVTSSSRLAVSPTSGGALSLIVVAGDGSTYSSPPLSALWDGAGGAAPTLPRPCRAEEHRTWCGGHAVAPAAAGRPAWMLPLDAGDALYVTGDGRLSCGTVDGAAPQPACSLGS